MKRAEEDRIIFLSLGTVFSVFSAVLVILTAVFLKNADYAAMTVTFIASAACIYGIPFSFFAAADAASALRFIPLYQESRALPYGEAIGKIALKLEWKTDAVEKLLRKCVKKKYV